MTMHHEVRIYSKNGYESTWGDGEAVVMYNVGQIDPKEKYPTVKEYDGIRISFQSEDPDARLYVDDFINDEERVVMPGDTPILVDPKNTSTMPSPGYYSLRIISQSGIFENLYLVEPRHLEWSYIHGLRSYLETRVKGITYDLLRRRSGVWSQETGGLHWFNLYRSVWTYMKVFRKQFELISAEPLEDLEKEYQIKMISRRPDAKSQRWLGGKGLQKNPYFHAPMRFYEKRTESNFNTPENQWLLWFFQTILRELKKIKLSFENWEYSKKQDFQKTEQELNELRKELAARQGGFYQSSFKQLINKLQNEIYFKTQQLRSIEIEFKRFERNKNELQAMMCWFSSVLNNSWLALVNVPTHVITTTMRLRKDPRYGVIYRIYREIRNDLRREKSVRSTTYPHLSTNKLMEVYTLCLICELLQGDDWQWVDGWVAGFNQELPTFSELKSGDILVFQRGDFKIEVAYDLKIDRNVEEGHRGFEAVTNDMPDIRVALYGPDQLFIKAMVVEVKHRNYDYLVNPQARDQSTDVTEQLKGYTRITYHCHERNTVLRDAIDRVVCVYPKQNKGKPYEERYRRSIKLIQIEPAIESTINPFGYEYVQKEVREFLSINIESLNPSQLNEIN